MTDINVLLAEMDGLREKATKRPDDVVSSCKFHYLTEGELMSHQTKEDPRCRYCTTNSDVYYAYLAHTYPTLRAHIEKLERTASLYLSDANHPTEEGCEAIAAHDKLRIEAEAGRVLADVVALGDNCKVSDHERHRCPLCNALSAYRTAIQDLTSKEE